jgi:hypothetical protein
MCLIVLVGLVCLLGVVLPQRNLLILSSPPKKILSEALFLPRLLLRRGIQSEAALEGSLFRQKHLNNIRKESFA